MKKILIILLLASMFGYAHRKIQCNGSALLIPRQIYIPLYKTPNGEKIDSIINDSIMEDYAVITIHQIEDNFANIISQGALIDTILRQGWIELKYLGINPARTDTIFLRKNADSNSLAQDTIVNPYWGDLYSIKKCNNGWLYICASLKGRKVEGWMSPEDQCDNPYTTCN